LGWFKGESKKSPEKIDLVKCPAKYITTPDSQ
jgi:hypothetical protein